MLDNLATTGPLSLVFLLLSLAAYRVTRFFVDDSLAGGNPRSGSEFGLWLDRWGRTPDGDDRVWWRGRLTDLWGCTYCLGAHVSWILTCLWLWVWPWQLGRDGWLTAVALAGAQALLNAADHRLNS
jgi:hypothetical protein